MKPDSVTQRRTGVTNTTNNSQPKSLTNNTQPKSATNKPRRVINKCQNTLGISLPFYFTIFLAILSIIVISYLPDSFYDDYTFGERAHNKSYKTFYDFYPHYLNEHSDVLNRQLHFIGTSVILCIVALQPILIPCVIIGGAVGYFGSTLFATLPYGILDGLLMFGAYLLFAALNDKFKVSLLLPLFGYLFAWVGHFFVEQNKPATFIYPCYSLMGDLRMWYDLITNTVPGLYVWLR